MRVYAAFILGMSVTWGVLELVSILPFDDYFKNIMRIVLPIPPILMALVMIYYGPAAYQEAAIAQCKPGAVLKSFFSGAFGGLVLIGLINVWKCMREKE